MATSNDTFNLRPVQDFPGYWVSCTGDVWTGWYPAIGGRRGEFRLSATPIRMLSIGVNKKTRYHHVILRKERKNYNKSVHVLVLEAFGPSRPPGAQVRHDNGDPEDNRIENLLWGSSKDNAADRIRHGTQTRGETSGRSNLTDTDVVAIVARCAAGERRDGVASDFGISLTGIGSILRGRVWAHVTGLSRKHGRVCKLTAESVLDVVRRFRGGEQQKRIAKSLSVSESSVMKILRGRTWASTTGLPRT